jgi:hypothetical protein
MTGFGGTCGFLGVLGSDFRRLLWFLAASIASLVRVCYEYTFFRELYSPFLVILCSPSAAGDDGSIETGAGCNVVEHGV